MSSIQSIPEGAVSHVSIRINCGNIDFDRLFERNKSSILRFVNNGVSACYGDMWQINRNFRLDTVEDLFNVVVLWTAQFWRCTV